MALVESLLLVWAPPHRAGRPFIAAGLAIVVAGIFVNPALVALGLIFAAFCLYFFRDPRRVPPEAPGAIVSGADGTVVMVGLAVPPAELGLGDVPRWRVATFLSVLNVHVNRVPAAGTITGVSYRRGRFLNASLDKASEENERNALAIRLAHPGPAGVADLAVVQIAGLIARRILCDVRAGDTVAGGQRFGIIRFGSRTDVYLPHGATPLVRVGQTMVGGETVLAVLP